MDTMKEKSEGNDDRTEEEEWEVEEEFRRDCGVWTQCEGKDVEVLSI